MLRSRHGRSGIAVARPAARAGTARAATPSSSSHFMAMCRSPARDCTAARARTRMARPPCRHFASCFRIMSPRSGSTWRHVGRHSCHTPPRLDFSPTSCRLHPAPTPPPCVSTSCAWPSGPRPNSQRTALLYRRLPGGVGQSAHPRGAHRGRPRWWLRPRLERPKDQLRGHRWPVGTRRS